MALLSLKTIILIVFGTTLCLFSCSNATSDNERFDCLPGLQSSKEACQSRGCKWQLPNKNITGVPKCFFPTTYGYRVQGDAARVRYGQHMFELARIKTPSLYKGHKEMLRGYVISYKTHLHFKIFSVGRYDVPLDMFEGFKVETVGKVNDVYSWELKKDPFGIVITRTKTNSVLFDSSVAPLIFADQFLQISTRLPSKYIYGFGEHEHKSFLHDINWKSYGMFTRDQYPKPDANLYGHHPFYMAMEPDGSAHGVLLLNSNAMDVTLQPMPALTYRTIGGNLEFYLFVGPSPEDVVKQYTMAVGRPFMPPYWSLGFQLSRWGYNSLERVRNITEKMRKFDIPQDVQYGDIDHMDRHVDFTYNKKTYAGLPEFVRAVKKDGLRYIIILDPAISANETQPYNAYDDGVIEDIFIKNEDGTTLFGKVWPYYPNVTIGIEYDWEKQTKFFRAYAAFPDWTHPNVTRYWSKVIKEHHSVIEFDGLWIDMNEPANFITGRVQGCPNNSMEHPPYWPTLIAEKTPKSLAEKTTCMNAKSYVGSKQYNTHSLYGLKQSQATFKALEALSNRRPFVTTRSTYPSNGKYAGHWLGDNLSAWSEMHKSIIGMLEFGLFGIPYIGADICGFRDTTTEELCRRWTQLGAFYPFARNHNSHWAKPQDPPYFGAKFARETREILLVRYTLLPYLYTLFYDAHTTGSTVVRPLMHEFTNDTETWSIDRQFMWGSGLLIIPVLEKNVTSTSAYFPKSRWYNYYNGEELNTAKSRNIVLNAPEDYIPLYLRGGTIIPTQQPANNTFFSRRNPFGLLVALDSNGKAKGSLFWDDGESNGTIDRGEYLKVNVKFEKNEIKWDVMRNGYKTAENLHLSSIKVFGICGSSLKQLLINGKAITGKATFNYTKRVLNATNLKLPITNNHRIKFELNEKDDKSCPYQTDSHHAGSHGHRIVFAYVVMTSFIILSLLLTSRYTN